MLFKAIRWSLICRLHCLSCMHKLFWHQSHTVMRQKNPNIQMHLLFKSEEGEAVRVRHCNASSYHRWCKYHKEVLHNIITETKCTSLDLQNLNEKQISASLHSVKQHTVGCFYGNCWMIDTSINATMTQMRDIIVSHDIMYGCLFLMSLYFIILSVCDTLSPDFITAAFKVKVHYSCQSAKYFSLN